MIKVKPLASYVEGHAVGGHLNSGGISNEVGTETANDIKIYSDSEARLGPPRPRLWNGVRNLSGFESEPRVELV
ncbi:hypothetical protein EVAR_49093_1 [Eumeta japonica]|uniref:Uncharacterized protein n=1 Tax=Eumeta variegata TaxID=151549 RepID=A0A4C1ZT79_EUMVA|nr:hypothetical protein EVAR_49093_1 [Eumeta japonica]